MSAAARISTSLQRNVYPFYWKLFGICCSVGVIVLETIYITKFGRRFDCQFSTNNTCKCRSSICSRKTTTTTTAHKYNWMEKRLWLVYCRSEIDSFNNIMKHAVSVAILVFVRPQLKKSNGEKTTFSAFRY